MLHLVAEMHLRALAMIETLSTRDEGQDMIEYALLAALIAVACIAALVVLGPKISSIFSSVSTSLSNV